MPSFRNIFKLLRNNDRGRRTCRHAFRAITEPLEERALLATIAQENALPGTPKSQWYISNADASILGFADNMSYNLGQTVSFKVNTPAPTFNIQIYRMGYYQGNGARLVATLTNVAGRVQPAGLSDPTTGLYDCGNWTTTATWSIPTDATSGIYFADLVRPDTGGASQVFFVVRNDSSHSDILLQTDDATWQAYNTYGGGSFYEQNTTTGTGRAFMVSYNRPFQPTSDRTNPPVVYAWDYPMVRWLEANGYDVSYTSDVDTDRSGSLLTNHKTFVSMGHDEYWSGGQRANVEAARAAGVSLAFFASNACHWKTRWLSSISSDGTPYRTLVCYKESLANAKIDPSPTWTGRWRDARFSPPSDGGRPDNALVGTLYMVNGTTYASMTVPSDDASLRFWRNTAVANLAPGQTYTTFYGLLGYEIDADVDNGFRPAGSIDLSSTVLNVSGKLLVDYGTQANGTGTVTHSLMLYRDLTSHALVFGSGTMQWSWALDADHNIYLPSSGDITTPPPVDPNLRQATVNLLADMGNQPATLQAGLRLATASTDTTGPTSVVTPPPAGGVYPAGQSITITGTASDTGGGVVAGVEVSVDDGVTWHPASGRASWSYTWTPGAPGTFVIRSRAADDSANLGTTSAGVSIAIGATSTAVASSANPSASGQSVTFTATVTPGTTLTPGALLQQDRATQGNWWIAPYGGEGYSVQGQPASLPPYATISVSGASTFTWASSTTDPRALQNPGGSGRSATTWYSPSSFTINVNLTDGQVHRLSIYAVDFNNTSKSEQVQLINASTGSVLDTETISTFFGGAYVQWAVSGNVRIQVTNLAPSTNAVVSGVFLDAAAPTGTVTFKDGATTLGTGTLSTVGGVTTASYTTSALIVGSHSITAAYSGNSYFAASTSAALSQVVNPAATSTALASSANPSAPGQSVTFTATITVSAPGSGTPTGTVTFKDGATTLGTGTLSTVGGVTTASYTTAALAAGGHSITAVYSGDASFAASTSAALAQIVAAAPTVTSVTPTNGATNVNRNNPNITATFNVDMDPTSLNGTTVILLDSQGLQASVTVSYDSTTKTVRIVPSAALARRSTYTVRIKGGSSGVMSSSGLAMAADYQWSFTTN